jgi:hypothetical protein
MFLSRTFHEPITSQISVLIHDLCRGGCLCRFIRTNFVDRSDARFLHKSNRFLSDAPNLAPFSSSISSVSARLQRALFLHKTLFVTL